MIIDDAINLINSYKSDSLTKNLSFIENKIQESNTESIKDLCASLNINNNLFTGAKVIKELSAEIDVIVHSVGILLSLDRILHDGEKIEYVSLGAGNTGKKFDLETNYRIAEYKFIDWKGGSESIRQNGIFKDFYELAENDDLKKKYLYLNGTEYPLKFFNGGRALTSVLSKQPIILENIKKEYGSKIERVRDYYNIYKDTVHIEDVREYLDH